MTLTNIQPVARLLLSATIVFALLAAVAGVSSALFSDSASIADSTFATGNVDLVIATDTGSGPGTYGPSIAGPLITGMMPGDTETFTFWLGNDSDSATELDLTAAILGVSSTGSPAIEDDLKVTFTCDVGNDLAGPGDGTTSTESVTTWETGTPAARGTGTLGPSAALNGGGTDEAKCTMTATLDTTSIADDSSVEFDAEFTGTQS